MVSGGLGFEARLLVVQWLLYFYLSGRYDSNPPTMAVAGLLRRKYTSSIKTLDPPDQFESSAAHSAAIVAFDLAAFLPSLAGDVILRGDKKATK